MKRYKITFTFKDGSNTVSFKSATTKSKAIQKAKKDFENLNFSSINAIRL